MRMFIKNYIGITKKDNSDYMKPNNSYKSSPLTKKQKKNRNKSKLARKARKK